MTEQNPNVHSLVFITVYNILLSDKLPRVTLYYICVKNTIFFLVFPSSLFMDSDSDVEESHPHSQEAPSPIPKLNTKNIKAKLYIQVFLTEIEATLLHWD